METRTFLRIASILVIGLFVTVTPASAQIMSGAEGQKAGIMHDLENLTTKYNSLAGAMEGKYDWRPADGVRSVGEVLNHIVGENRYLIAVLNAPAGTSPSMTPPAEITDPEQLRSALRTSYDSLKTAVSAITDLEQNISFFGHDVPKIHALFGMLLEQHEHLGQSIAYARMNGVKPPWTDN